MFLSMFAVARGGALASPARAWPRSSPDSASAISSMCRARWRRACRCGDPRGTTRSAAAIRWRRRLWGLAAGAVSGTGAGLGHTRFVPEGHTDLVLAAIGEELGLVGLLIVGAAFVLITWRGIRIARRASSDYGFFLALAMTLSLAIPVLVMAAGVLGVLPLTGVVTPFLSYGGSAMAANFVALGLLVAIGCGDRPVADLAPFHTPGAVVVASGSRGCDDGARRLWHRADAAC